MDPNNLQNNINGAGNGGHNNFNNVPANQGFGHNMAQAAGQYNNMLLQQQYFNIPFGMNYNNQLLDFQQAQQQYLMQQQLQQHQLQQQQLHQQQQQQHQQQPLLQQQHQYHGMSQMLTPQQQLMQLMQQQQHQQIPQVQQVQQQVAPVQQIPAQQQHSIQIQQPQPQRQAQQELFQQQQTLLFDSSERSAQAKILEEQCRQMERARKEQEERKKKHEAEEARKRVEEAKKQRLQEERRFQEEQQRIREQMERERLEEQKRQEEAARLEDERRVQEEKERIERENLQRFAEEQCNKERVNRNQRIELENKFAQITQPLTLVGTHFLPNFLDMIPFPYESMSESRLPHVFDMQQNGAILDNCDPAMVAMISDLLASTNVDDIVTRMDKLRPEDKENNDLCFDKLPPLIRAVVNYSTSALDVDSHVDLELLENEDVMMTEDITKSSMLVESNSYHPQESSHAHTSENHSSSNSVDSPAISMEKRRQMMSIGKAPKGKGNPQRKKRDMVENLYDSLTDNFVPTDGGRRGRRRQRDDDDDEDDLQRDLDLIAAMEAGEKLPASVTGFDTTDGDNHHFFERKRKRRREDESARERRDRSPTPEDVIDARDAQWQERLRMKQEREKNRKSDEDHASMWSLQALADNDTYVRFSQSVDGILEQAESLDTELIMPKKKRRSDVANESGDGDEEEELDEIDPDLRIDLGLLEELRRGSSRLRENRVLHAVGPERLMKLITMLDRNMRDAISADNQRLLVPCDTEAVDAFEKEICEERVKRAVDAAVVALNIMSSYKMHKQVIIEDVIDRSIGLTRLLLLHMIYPASDSVYRMMNTKRKDKGGEEVKRRKRIGICNRDRGTDYIYERITEIVALQAALVKTDSIPDTSVHNLAGMALTPFFIANVGTLQVSSLLLCSNIFARADDTLRFSMITDFLASLHRAPQFTQKNASNGYILHDGNWISMTTALFVQLVQSCIKVPKYKKNLDEEEAAKRAKKEETLVKESFQQASKVTNAFLNGFLQKCSQKGNKLDGEEDYRILFSNFLSELLAALYSPEWPAVEMILTSLGSLLVKNFRAKTTDMTVRQACLEYLGNITASLKKDMLNAINDRRLDSVVRKALFLVDDTRYPTLDSVDISEYTTNEKLKILESSLVDYLVLSNSSDLVMFACTYYVGEWYKETVEDIESAEAKHKDALAKSETEKDVRKAEKKYDRLVQKGIAMKQFLAKLIDKKELKRRLEKSNKVKMLDSDARWAVKFLAQSREFNHSFETYLKHIVFGAGSETVVALRSKALKCMSQIIEADSKVLILEDVRNAVHSRMVDSHAQVRESAVELIGRFVLYDEEYVRQYYSQIAERILDTGVAVRKRVIRIMREICEKFPKFEMIPDMLSRMIRRVTDEEGVKKLVYETFTTLWFQPSDTRSNPNAVLTKVITICGVAQHCFKDKTSEFLETLILHIVKNGSEASGMSVAVKQIVDTLVDLILSLEVHRNRPKAETDKMTPAEVANLQLQEEKYMAHLSTLGIFSKVRPNLFTSHVEVLLPYLTFDGPVKTNTDLLVRREMIGMLERVIPLIPFPNPDILESIDNNLSKFILFNPPALVVPATSCVATIFKKFNKKANQTMTLFQKLTGSILDARRKFERDPAKLIDTTDTVLARSIFVLGVLSRYFGFEKILTTTASQPVDQRNVDSLQDKVFAALDYFSRFGERRKPRVYKSEAGRVEDLKQERTITLKAISSLGHFCAQHSTYLTKKQLQDTYLRILQNKSELGHNGRVAVLQNLEIFLQCEEQKLAASHENWEANKEMENLKEMELSGSGLGSSVIQKYWKAVLDSYVDTKDEIRKAAVQVVWLTLNQGLVTPGASIPTLIAMTTDTVEVIRNRIDILLKDIDSKYSGMVQSKAMLGVRLAYKLHLRLRETPEQLVRGFRYCDFHLNANNARLSVKLPTKTHDGMAVLSGLYQSLRTNRQQRRSFLTAIVKLFSEETSDKPDLREHLFIADNLAMFPYQMIDEPLYVIRLIDQNVALTGQALLVQYKQYLRMSEGEDEDIVFMDHNLVQRLSHLNQTSTFHNLFLSSQVPSILLYVRTFLMQQYGFNETKVAEYLPSEAAKVYEKAVTRRNIPMFNPVTALEALHFPYQLGSYEHTAFLAEKIASFRKMLLSLDQVEEVDLGGNPTTVNQGDDYDEEDQLADPDPEPDMLAEQ